MPDWAAPLVSMGRSDHRCKRATAAASEGRELVLLNVGFIAYRLNERGGVCTGILDSERC